MCGAFDAQRGLVAAPSYEGRVLVRRLGWKRLLRWLERRRYLAELHDEDRADGIALISIDLIAMTPSVILVMMLCPDPWAVLCGSIASKCF